jgi:hypothetical protein
VSVALGASSRAPALAFDEAASGATSSRTPSAELVWRTESDSECSTRAQIRARIAGLTARGLAEPALPQRYPRIVVEVRRHESTWRGQIRVFDADGHSLGARDLLGKSPDCRSLDVALSLVIATLLDALPSPAAASGARSPAADSSKLAAVRRTRSDPLGIGASAGVGLGLVPNAAFGMTLGFELPIAGASISIDGSAYLPRDDVDARGHGARLWAWHAGVGFCPRLVRGKLPLEVCGGVQLGAIQASALGLRATSHKQRLIVLAGLEPKLGIRPTDAFGLQLSIFGGWAPIRPTFTLDTGGSELDTLRGAPFVLLLRIGIIGFVR